MWCMYLSLMAYWASKSVTTLSIGFEGKVGRGPEMKDQAPSRTAPNRERRQANATYATHASATHQHRHQHYPIHCLTTAPPPPPPPPHPPIHLPKVRSPGRGRCVQA